MRPTQRNWGCCQEYAGASHGGGGRRLSWVRYFSVSSMSMLQLLRFVLCQDEFSKALTLLRRGRRFWGVPRVDGASETQFLSSFRDVEQLFPDRLGRRAKFAILSHVSYEEGGLRLGTLHTWTHSLTSIQTRHARKRSVTVILAQRENPLIEISAILTQCDRALSECQLDLPSTGILHFLNVLDVSFGPKPLATHTCTLWGSYTFAT